VHAGCCETTAIGESIARLAAWDVAEDAITHSSVAWPPPEQMLSEKDPFTRLAELRTP
jgi:hypothetical protein